VTATQSIPACMQRNSQSSGDKLTLFRAQYVSLEAGV